jgi:hypothetical protein
MPGFAVTMANQVFCTHGGKATPMPPVGRVATMGFGLVTLAHSYLIAGCGFPAATLGAQPPCVTGVMTTGSVRVRTMGIPIAILPDTMPTSKGLPNPTPLIFAPAGPARVWAT